MDNSKIWRVLELEETKDQNLIKNAYRKKLSSTNPEDDPEGFMDLRTAYEEALKFSNIKEDINELTDKTDVELWIDDIDKLYKNILKRGDISSWEKLLQYDICNELDTWIDAREQLLVYLMDNFYLPKSIWELLDKQFDIVKDQESLYSKFPKNFMDYAIDQIYNGELIDLNLFVVTGNDPADEYMSAYYKIRRLVNEKNLDDLPPEFEKIEKLTLYHPSTDAEKLRYFMAMDNTDGIQSLIEKLKCYQEDDYIAFYLARAYWYMKKHQDAATIWTALCEKYPLHYGARIGLIEYDIHMGEYKKANEDALDLLNHYPSDEPTTNLLVKANEYLIEEYKEKLKENPEDLESKEELAWCYYQNNFPELCIELLNEFPEDSKKLSWYLRLNGYAYFKLEKYDETISYMEPCLVLLKSSGDENQMKKYYSVCSSIISGAYIAKKEYKNALPYLTDAIAIEEDINEKLHLMERLAFTYLQLDQNEDCIDQCDEIIKMNKGYYPAYLNRQKAYFNLKNGKEVIDDYYNAVNIYPGYIMPYLLAAKVYYIYDMCEDSMIVINKAEEQGLNCNELELYKGMNKRILSKTNEEREESLQILLDLVEKIKNPQEPEDEYTDLPEVYHQISRTYASLGDFETGLVYIDKALEQSSYDNTGYEVTKAYLYMDLKEYENAKNVLYNVLRAWPENENIHNCMAECLVELKNNDEAIKWYEKTLEINRNNIEALEKLSDLYDKLYLNEEIVSYYDKANHYALRLIELTQSIYYYIHVGIILQHGYDLEESLEFDKKALELDPNNIWPYNNSGYTLKIMGRYEEAIQSLKKSIELMKPGESAKPHSNLADVYETLGENEKCVECYEEIIKHDPDALWARKEIAYRLSDMNRTDEAVNYCLDLMKNHGLKKSETYYMIMTIYIDADDMHMAGKYAKKILHCIYSEEKPSAYMLSKVSQFYRGVEKYRKAINLKEKALSLIAEDNFNGLVQYNYEIAEIYYDWGKKKDAQKYAQKSLDAINNHYGNEETYTAYPQYKAFNNCCLGVIHLILNNYELSEKYLTAATQCVRCKSCTFKKCYEAYIGLGRLHEAKEEYESAKEYYELALQYCSNSTCKKLLKSVKDKCAKSHSY